LDHQNILTCVNRWTADPILTLLSAPPGGL